MAVTYDYYRIFYYVAQYKSFTQAAQVLENNQPNITRCMNNLEQELGCRLFVRSNRGVTLTVEGERLYQRVSVACEQLRLAEEEIRRDCSLEEGAITIGASEIALHLFLLDKLSLFRTKYPGVRLKIVNYNTPQAVESLRRGQSDCAVITTPIRLAKPLKETRLLSFREILLCGPQYRELAGETHSLRELERYPFVCLGRETTTFAFYQRLFAKQDLPFRVDIEATTMDQVLPMVSHNLGVGFYSESLAAPALANHLVYQVPLAETIPQRHVCLIEDSSRPQSVAMRTLRKLLLEPQEPFPAHP